MRTRINVSLIPGERAAAWSLYTEDDRCARRSISHAAALDSAPILGSGHDLLDCYLKGWAEVNLGKIFAATARNYCFDDPIIG